MFDYKEKLANSFTQRIKANPKYSLRAFARDVGLSPSRMSEIFSGKGELSRDKASKIAKNLKFNAAETSLFMDQIDAVSASTLKLRAEAKKRIENRKSSTKDSILSESNFELVANPLFIAIWSFMLLPLYDGTAECIASHFKVTIIELYSMLRKLENADLIFREQNHWKARPGQFSIGDQSSSKVRRAYHLQISAMGRHSIEAVPVELRHLDSAVLPIESSRLAEIRESIEQFIVGLIETYGSSQGDSVYGLSLQFFPMIHKTPPKKL